MWGSASGHKIESETEPDIDFGSFLMSSITTGHESESEFGVCKTGDPNSLSITYVHWRGPSGGAEECGAAKS